MTYPKFVFFYKNVPAAIKGKVSCLYSWVNCHVSSFNSTVIETIESTDAGNGTVP